MSLLLGIPLLLAAAVFQSAVLSHVRVFGGQPDLVVIIVLAWSVLDDDREGMAWAFVGGLLLDLFSGAPFGLSTLVLVAMAFVVGLAEAQVYRNNVLLTLLLTLLGTAAYHIGHMILLRFAAGFNIIWAEAFWYVTLPSVLFDVILILPMLRVLGHWYDRLHPRLGTV
jgi:rod shape-determining protein MreD